MFGWDKRVSPESGVTFIWTADQRIEMLVPPGSGTDRWGVDRSDLKAGLWLRVCWHHQLDDVLVDHDQPDRSQQTHTVKVLDELGKRWRDEVARVLLAQFEQLWALTRAQAGFPPEDRRAHAHAAVLMALTDEARAAFPEETFWKVRLPHREDAELVAWFYSADGRPAADPVVSGRDLLRFVLRAWMDRLRGRPRPRYSQLGAYCESQLAAAQPTQEAGQPDGDREEPAVSSASAGVSRA